MTRFRIDTGKVSGKVEDLVRLERQLAGHADELEKTASKLRSEKLSDARRALKRLSTQLCREAEQTGRLRAALEMAAEQYSAVEESLKTPVPSGENPAFDRKGSYGGSQCAPLSAFREEERGTYQELCRIVRSYYPEYSDYETERLMQDLELEGCGYVALANTLFGRYAGREEMFRNTFGFSMYDNRGELNYELLVTDLYCSEDDRKKTGTTQEDRERIWEHYLERKGIPVDVRTLEVTVENYEELSWEGEMIVGICPCVLYDRSGEKVIETGGGHAMSVTGITEDGMFRVSSWGAEYYIKPEDPVYERIQFQQVCYEEGS